MILYIKIFRYSVLCWQLHHHFILLSVLRYLNYDYDSEEDWEEEESGESLSESEHEEEEEEMDGLDYNDGWLRKDDDFGSGDEEHKERGQDWEEGEEKEKVRSLDLARNIYIYV